jgi:hypothetical protein
MSWNERIENPYQITTGDGQQYTVLWKNAVITQQFNLSIFEFENVSGSLVKKSQPVGRRFNVEFYFTGDDHLDVRARFEQSANDVRPWNVNHPYFDNLLVQPVAPIVYDTTGHNVTKVTTTIMESITVVLPRGTQQPTDIITEGKVNTDELAVTAADLQVETLTATEVQGIDQNLDFANNQITAIIETDTEAFNFQNTLLDAKAFVENAINRPIEFLRKVQDVINFPFQLVNSVRQRINVLRDVFDGVVTSLGNLTGLSKNEKSYFEFIGSAAVSSQCAAAVTNTQPGTETGDEEVLTVSYETVDDVDEVVSQIVELFNTYIDTLDAVQTDTATDPESFVPNAEAAFALQQLVSFTIARLFEIALDNQVEQQLEVEADTNIIELAHRIYGLDELDENLERLIRQNNISLNELFLVPKGRVIRYYK